MNICTPMPDGSLHALTPREAEILRGYLLHQLPRVQDPRERARMHGEIDRLRAVSEPQRAYDEWGLA